MASSVYFTKVAAGTGREAIGVCMDHECGGMKRPRTKIIFRLNHFSILAS
jgi:hypothetical protein